MDSATRSELNSIINELQSIINELGDIAQGVRTNFKNIGNDKCAQALESMKDKITTVKRDVSKI